MNWQIYLTAIARKELKRLPDKVRSEIKIVFEKMKIDPFAGDIAKLGGQPGVWRWRVGNYRISFNFSKPDNLIQVLTITHRTSTTYK